MQWHALGRSLSFDCDTLTPLLEGGHAATQPTRESAPNCKAPHSQAMGCNEDDTHSKPTLWRENPLLLGENRSSPAIRDAALEFGRFRVLLRQRQLLADGVRLELGTRAFDLLVVLLEADGSLVTKEELLGRVWPGIVVSEGNLKVQVSALRRALGADRSAIRTEFGRGYRFTGVLCSITAADACHTRTWAKLPSARSLFPVPPRARSEPSPRSTSAPSGS